MLKLVLGIILLVAACSAQEHFTCMRTDNASTQPSTHTPQRALRGSPGKRGAKGQKGEPGIPDNHQINLLRVQIDVLSQEVETLKNQSRQNQLKEQVVSLSEDLEVLKNQSRENHQQDQIVFLSQDVETLKNQSRENRQLLLASSKLLYIPPYFYLYQLTPGLSWQESRQYCRNWGGDLAVHGVKTLQNRKKLLENLSINTWIWIGANDITSEGNWIWVNGERASSSELIWYRSAWREPTGDDDHDCVHVWGRSDHLHAGFAGDYSCAHVDPGLCEKRI